MARHQSQEIREFILWNVEEHPASITSLAAKKFGLSRTGIGRYMNRLIEEGLVTAEGVTRGRRYALKPLRFEAFNLERNGRWTEDTIWRENILPLMKGVKQNIVDICQYGFTEMLNNVLDHSGSPNALIGYKQTYTTIDIGVTDYGVGIFNKI